MVRQGLLNDACAERLRGEIAAFDIKDAKGKLIVEQGRRVTARHIRQLEESKINKLLCPADYCMAVHWLKMLSVKILAK